MRCPFCKSVNVSVVDSRSRGDGTSIWRRRECLSCEKRFSSKERIDFSEFSVKKRNGDKEPFSREKILMSIFKSLGKRPLDEEKLETAVDEITQEIHRNGKTDIRSSVIGDLVLDKLKKLDPIIYIRYASVYKDFRNTETFKKELKDLDNS